MQVLRDHCAIADYHGDFNVTFRCAGSVHRQFNVDSIMFIQCSAVVRIADVCIAHGPLFTSGYSNRDMTSAQILRI